jgi:hypothetical protein
MECSIKYNNGNNPFNDKTYPFYALIEIATNDEEGNNTERLIKLLSENETIIIVILFKYKSFKGRSSALRWFIS